MYVCNFHSPSSIIAVVTFFPVIPWSQAACTFKSKRILPPFWPVFFKYHCKGKYGSVGSRPTGCVPYASSNCRPCIAGIAGRRPRLTRLKPGCWMAVWICEGGRLKKVVRIKPLNYLVCKQMSRFMIEALLNNYIYIFYGTKHYTPFDRK